MNFTVIEWTADGAVRYLDQTLLPDQEVYREARSVDEMIEAIQALRVRGAPLIGISAAMGLVAAAAHAEVEVTLEWVREAVARLAGARPTAVNLEWALRRMEGVATRTHQDGASGKHLLPALRREAQRIWDEDAAMCRAIGEAGQGFIAEGATVLTHCNAGALATGGIGTALGVIYAAWESGRRFKVVSCETRPLRQGARLTSWELSRSGVPVTAIVDSAAGALMADHGVDLVITGADRIAANGDVANKIGTYSLAVLARAHGVPFYVAAPRSTFDASAETGRAIPIELRQASEVQAAPGAAVHNPAFDVTPADYVTALVTDRGVIRPPYREGIARMLELEV